MSEQEMKRAACAPQALADAVEYCPTSCWKRIQSRNILLLDIGERVDTDKLRFDVPHYLNVPFSELEQRLQEVPKDREIIVAGMQPMQSLKATYFLMFHGYAQVANMKFGLQRWISKGFPVIGDVGQLSTSVSGCCGSGSGSCC